MVNGVYDSRAGKLCGMSGDHHAVHTFFYTAGIAGFIQPHVMCKIGSDALEAFFNKINTGSLLIVFKSGYEVE